MRGGVECSHCGARVEWAGMGRVGHAANYIEVWRRYLEPVMVRLVSPLLHFATERAPD